MKAMIWDTETTDLIHNIGRPMKEQPYVIEWFSITVDHELMETTEYLSFLCKPPMQITAETTRITGITWPMLVNEPGFKERAQIIKASIESHDRVVAHNAGFDVDVTNIEFARLGMKIDWPEIVCTIESTEFWKGYRLNLGALHTEIFGHDFADHHRAEPDTRALAKCYIELLRMGVL